MDREKTETINFMDIVQHHEGADGSSTISFIKDGKYRTAHKYEWEDTYHETTYQPGEVAQGIRNAASGFLCIVLLIFAVFALNAVRSSLYSIAVFPGMIAQLAQGKGIGWLGLGVLGAGTLACVVTTRFTERAGGILSVVWALVFSILLIVYSALADPASGMAYQFSSMNLIEYIGSLISAAAHVFMLVIALHGVMMLFSLSKEKAGLYLVLLLCLLGGLMLLGGVCYIFGVYYPSGEWDMYRMVEPLCKLFRLSAQDMSPWTSPIGSFMHSFPWWVMPLAGIGLIGAGIGIELFRERDR